MHVIRRHASHLHQVQEWSVNSLLKEHEAPRAETYSGLLHHVRVRPVFTAGLLPSWLLLLLLLLLLRLFHFGARKMRFLGDSRIERQQGAD